MIDNDTGAMCCLGVLEYACEGKVTSFGLPYKSFLKRNNIIFRNSLGDANGIVTPFLTGGTANHLNDVKGLSFKQIAQRLKSRVKFN